MEYKSLDQMIDDAEAKGLWLFCGYQQLWFSPEELREENKKGRLRWGPKNWKLIDPQERIDQMQKLIQDANEELTTFIKRVDASTQGAERQCKAF